MFKGLEEATIAAVVGVIIQVLNMVIPDWDWEKFRWKELTRLGLCELVAYGIFGLSCYGDVEIPGLAPICGAQGAFNAGVAGILAFMINKYAEDEGLRWLRRRMRELKGIAKPFLIVALILEGVALILGAPILVSIVLAVVGSSAITLYWINSDATITPVFRIKLSLLFISILTIVRMAVRFPGNPLGLTLGQKIIVYVIVWALTMVVLFLTHMGVIEET